MKGEMKRKSERWLSSLSSKNCVPTAYIFFSSKYMLSVIPPPSSNRLMFKKVKRMLCRRTLAFVSQAYCGYPKQVKKKKKYRYMYTRSSLRRGEAARKRRHVKKRRKEKDVQEKVAKMLCFENDQCMFVAGQKVKNVRAFCSR